MIIETLLVKSDGSQSIIQKEVPDDWFDIREDSQNTEAEATQEENSI